MPERPSRSSHRPGAFHAPPSLPTPGRLSNAIMVLVIVLLFFETAAYGAVEAWSELVALALSGLIVVALLLRHVLDRDSRPPSSWLWAPIGLFAALAVLQAAPLPAAWAEMLAPGTLQNKEQLLGGGELSMSSLSYYPRETWRTFRLMLIGSSLLAAAIALGREQGGVERLLTLVFAVGCGEGVFALAQIIAQADWAYAATGRSVRDSVTAGTFLNYSNFSQFMNLAIGAGLGLLLVRTERRRRATGRYTGWDEFWRADGWIVCGLAVSCLAVFTSMSRNGVLSMIIAGGCFLLMITLRRSSTTQAWALAAIPLAVFTGLCVVGFDLVYDRLATLSNDGVLADRWRLTADTLRAWSDHPVWGIGLNAHEYAFSSYDTTGALAVAQTADNDYAQLIEETGVVGASLVAVALGLVVWCVLRAARSRQGADPLAAYGVAFGLIAVGLHSWTDFGQRIPAVFSLTALALGILVVVARRDASSPDAPRWGGLARRRLQGAAAAIVLIPLWAVSLAVAYRAAQAEKSWAEAYYQEQTLASRDWEGSVDEYRFLLRSAEAAAALESNNVRYAYRLNLYRWQSMLWAGSSTGPPNQLSPEFVEVTSAVVDALRQTRELCPTFGPAYALEGQLRYHILGDKAEGERQILLAAELAPMDPTALFNAGSLRAQQGEGAQAEEFFERLLALNDAFFPRIAEQLVVALGAPEAAERMCGDVIARWDALAKLYEQQGADLAEQAPRLHARSAELLEQAVASGTASPAQLARLAALLHRSGESERSVELLRRSLASDYNNLARRLQLAQRLRDIGAVDQALHEAKICLRLSPGDKRAIRLVDELYELSLEQQAAGE